MILWRAVYKLCTYTQAVLKNLPSVDTVDMDYITRNTYQPVGAASCQPPLSAPSAAFFSASEDAEGGTERSVSSICWSLHCLPLPLSVPLSVLPWGPFSTLFWHLLRRRRRERQEEAPTEMGGSTKKAAQLDRKTWEAKVLYKILPLTIPGLAKQTCHFYTKFYFELYLITKLSISALIPELFGMSKKYFTKKRSFLQISNDFYAYYNK